MKIKIQNDSHVYFEQTNLQTGSNKVLLEIVNKTPHCLYRVGFNDEPLQEIVNGTVELPVFTNEVNSVIIKVEISQMGKVNKTFSSDVYPLRYIPVVGNIVTETFPIALSNIIRDNTSHQKYLRELHEAFEKAVVKRLNDFENRVLYIENKGEIV